MSIIFDYVPNNKLYFEKIKKTIELAYNQVIESLNEKVLSLFHHRKIQFQ
jgi:hypothetical protein